MPRKERVLPSLRPRRLPHLVSTTGGARFGPAADDSGEPAGAAAGFGFPCPKAFRPPAATPPSTAVVVPSIVRRFIRPILAPPLQFRLLHAIWAESDSFYANVEQAACTWPSRTAVTPCTIPVAVFGNSLGK